MLRDTLKRMDTELNDVVHYTLDIHGANHKMNDYIGKKIKIEWSGVVICQCGKKSDKFYRSGYCYKCFWESPLASQSIFKPELCTAHLGIEERDLEWGKRISTCTSLCILSQFKWNKGWNNKRFARGNKMDGPRGKPSNIIS